MLYGVLRWIAGIALQWFYRDIEVDGAEHIPRDAPLLLAVNHPNAMVDAIVVMHTVRRRILLTAKATLFENWLLRAVFPAIGIIPLRRAKDEEQRTPSNLLSVARNEESFRAIMDALSLKKAVLIFPEGVSHNQPSLAPLKTGLARLALQARDERGVRGLKIIPIGLTFERKWAPRTRILVHVGEPIAMDTWQSDAPRAAEALTREVDARLRAHTLNFPTMEDAARSLTVARILSSASDEVRPLGRPEAPLANVAEVVRRIERTRGSLPASAFHRVEVFLNRLDALQQELVHLRISVSDIGIRPGIREGAWFAIREGAIIALAGPVAWWGRINHWAPLTIAQRIARSSSKSPEDPAMHTLVLGLGLVLIAYTIQTAAVWYLAGTRLALLYLISLPIAATWDFRFRDRMRRAWKRTRTYFRFRSDRSLQPRLANEVAWLRDEAAKLESLRA